MSVVTFFRASSERPHVWIAAVLWILAGADVRAQARDDAVALPAGVRAVWDLEKAHRGSTPTRARVSLNGLWRWQPVQGAAAGVPQAGWGYFKVSGPWPGITDYMQKDCQTVFVHPTWREVKLGGISAAWYQREIEVPREWMGRKIALELEYLNSHAAVYVDGK